jgi:hypothetical protein
MRSSRKQRPILHRDCPVAAAPGDYAEPGPLQIHVEGNSPENDWYCVVMRNQDQRRLRRLSR